MIFEAPKESSIKEFPSNVEGMYSLCNSCFGWVINKDKKKALIYYGGNNQDLSEIVPIMSQMFPNHATYLIPYRGYNGNPGRPTELKLYQDAIAIFRSVKSQHESVGIIGCSLGSGVATFIASCQNVDKLVLITPYDRLDRVAFDKYPLFPMSLLVKDKFNSESRAHNITCPTLVLMVEGDEVIKNERTYNLIDKMPKVPRVLSVTGVDHGNCIDSADLRSSIRLFIGR